MIFVTNEFARQSLSYPIGHLPFINIRRSDIKT